MKSKKYISAISLVSTALIGINSAYASQEAIDFPNKPIKFVVPYTPGGATDTMARSYAQQLSKELKTPVVIENKPGAGTSIGVLAVKNAPADGYTILFQTGENLTTKLSNPSVAYSFSDFEIISSLAQTPFALMVPSKNKIKKLEGLKEISKTKGGELDFGSLGFGANHYSSLSARLSNALDVRSKMIPYKGGMEGVTAVMSGEIDGYFATIALTISQKNSNKIDIMAVTSESGRSPFLPNVPTFKELGFEGMDFKSYYGAAVRVDTPKEIKNKLIAASNKVIASEEFKKLRASISLEEFVGTNEEYVAATLSTYEKLKSDYQKNTP